MRKKVFKIVVFTIIFIIMALHFTFSKEKKNNSLALKNIESITRSEIDVEDVCTRAGGYCFRDGREWAGISMERN